MDISASSDNALHRPPSEGRCVSRRPYVQERSSQHSRGPSSCDPTESPDETGQTARSSVAHAWIGLAGHQFLNSRATDLVRTHPRRGCDHADRITAGGVASRPLRKRPVPPPPPLRKGSPHAMHARTRLSSSTSPAATCVEPGCRVPPFSPEPYVSISLVSARAFSSSFVGDCGERAGVGLDGSGSRAITNDSTLFCSLKSSCPPALGVASLL